MSATKTLNIVLDLDNTLISSVEADDGNKKFLPREKEYELKNMLNDETLTPDKRGVVEDKLKLLQKISKFNFNVMGEDIEEDISASQNFLYLVFSRPHLQEFLDYLFANFKVSVWSAASKPYVLFIVNNIIYRNHPERKLEWIFFDEQCDISKRIGLQKEIKSRLRELPPRERKMLIGSKEEKTVLTKDERERIKEECVKDLSIFWDVFNIQGFSSSNTIIIDDLPEVHFKNVCNSIQVKPFNFDEEGSENDDFLLHLIDFLRTKKEVLETSPTFCVADHIPEKSPISPSRFDHISL
jgi:TFIIF-interacting CTD phosphatase-like protein